MVIYMKAGSMEGLIGASINTKISRTPMRVFKEAELRGDTETMKRAMGYVREYQDKAQECSDREQEALPKELEEERREQEARRQQALERRKETKEYVEKVQENNKPDTPKEDNVTISEEGKVSLKNNSQTEEADAPAAEPADVKMYTSEGKPVLIEAAAESGDKKVDIKC